MNSRKKFLKEAGVLLLAVVMILSSGIAIANTNNQKKSIDTTVNTPYNPNNSPVNTDLIWDNVVGVHADLGGIIVATVRAEGTAFPADDFKLDSTRDVDSLFWQGGYFQCQLAEGQKDYQWDWRIIFWDDCGDGSHPGNEIHNWTIPDADIQRDFWYIYTRPDTGNTYWVANYSTQLPETVTFTADTTYWITVQTIQGTNLYPQGCWCRHNDSVGGIKLHEAMIKAVWWGYPDWTAISVLAPDHLPHDLNYQLLGPSLNNPPGAPSINGQTDGKINVKYNYTLNAVDPDTDDVYYYVDWGDTTNSGWVGPYASGVDTILSHTWLNKGTYTVKAKAKDIYDAESDWTELTVIITKTKNKAINEPLLQLLQNFLENHPNLYTILQKII
jgi:hypothetical protein